MTILDPDHRLAVTLQELLPTGATPGLRAGERSRGPPYSTAARPRRRRPRESVVALRSPPAYDWINPVDVLQEAIIAEIGGHAVCREALRRHQGAGIAILTALVSLLSAAAHAQEVRVA